MGPEIVASGLGINADYPGIKRGISGLFETLSRVLAGALNTFGIQAQFRPKNDLEVDGKKIAGLSAAAETGKSLLFHTSLLVNFDIPLMLDIMNSPLNSNLTLLFIFISTFPPCICASMFFLSLL